MIDYRKLYSKYDKEDLINTCINLKEYKERLRKEVNKSYMICNEKDKEIERLNNIINEIEKYAQDLLENGTWSKCGAHKILDKLQELKGSDK